MVNKTPLADLPSIDEFIVEPEELPSVVEFLPEEVVEEEIQTIEDADGNAFLEVEDVIKAPEWGELVRMVNDVRKDIPEIPEVKDYAPELEEISANIQQIKNEIPVVPEVRYYEEELQALRESISKVEDSIPTLPLWIHKVTEVPDFAWVGKGFNVIDEDFRGVRDTISTLAARVTTELERIQEEGDTKQFETKTDFKTIHERVDTVRKDIFKELREQSTVIWNLQKKLKNNQKEFEITFNEKVGERFDAFSEVTKKTVDNLQESFVESTDNLAKHMDGEIKSLQERIKTLPKPKYYEEDIKNIKKELKDLTELKSIVYDIKITQGDIQEGLLNIPPNVDNSDPLTPLDQNFATHEDLAKHYRLFINRVQQQISVLGGGGAVRFDDLEDVGIGTYTKYETTATNPGINTGTVLIYDSNLKIVGIASTALTTDAETLDQTLKQGNTSTMGMNVSGITTLSNTTNATSASTGALIVSGGVGIAKSLHVTGNISCAGTTYYEDVTNIDSVGIVTARTRLLVGTGVTYSPTELVVDGDGRVTGVLTVGTGSITLDPSTDTITAAVIEQTDGVKLSDKASIGMVLALS